MHIADLERQGFPAPDQTFLEGRGARWNDTINAIPASHSLVELGTDELYTVHDPEIILLHKGLLAVTKKSIEYPGMIETEFNYPDSEDFRIVLPSGRVRLSVARIDAVFPSREDIGPALYTSFHPKPGAADTAAAITIVRQQGFDALGEPVTSTLQRIHEFIARNRISAASAEEEPKRLS